MANFTNSKINQTYQRVVQVDGGVLQNGLGTTLSGSMSDLTVNGTLAITGHSNVSSSLSRLDNFSSSLNDTFASDAELASVSSSLASETAQLLNFSASLDATFATDAELSSLSSSLVTTIDNIQHTDISALNTFTGSADTRLTSLEGFSSSLDATFATDTEVSTAVSGLNAATGSYAIKTQISGSFNELSSSFATRFDDITHSDVSGLNAATSSYAIKTQISGSFVEASSSIAVDINNLQSSVGGLGATYATLALVNSNSASFATRFDDIQHSDVSGLNAATSSYALKTEISGSFLGQPYAITGSNTFNDTQVISDSKSLKINTFDNPGTGGGVEIYLDSSGSQVYGGVQIINTSNFNAGMEINSYTGLDGTNPVFRFRGGGNNKFGRNVILNAFSSSLSGITIEKSAEFQDGLTVSSSQLLELQPATNLPTGSSVLTGSLAVSGSGSDLAVYLFAGTGSFGPGYMKITGTLS